MLQYRRKCRNVMKNVASALSEEAAQLALDFCNALEWKGLMLSDASASPLPPDPTLGSSSVEGRSTSPPAAAAGLLCFTQNKQLYL